MERMRTRTMDRKTWRRDLDGFSDVGLREGITVGDAIRDLADYEDTGLTPEQIESALSEKTVLDGVEKLLGVKVDRLHVLADADRDGRVVVLPCKVGDICYEVDPGHPGVIKHTVTGTTVYNRQADGNRYMTDFVNVITIDTWAVAEDGCEWADQYTVAEWADAPKTRPEAEAALASVKQVEASAVASEVHKPGGEQDA